MQKAGCWLGRQGMCPLCFQTRSQGWSARTLDVLAREAGFAGEWGRLLGEVNNEIRRKRDEEPSDEGL